MPAAERCIATGSLRGFLPASLCAASGLATLLAPAAEASTVLLLGLSAVTLAAAWTAWQLIQCRHHQTEPAKGQHPKLRSGLATRPKPINMLGWQAEQDRHKPKDRIHPAAHP